ncbi:hypothetical protein MBLNU230_g5129t1 [Neophaeotheca triangularis]
MTADVARNNMRTPTAERPFDLLRADSAMFTDSMPYMRQQYAVPIQHSHANRSDRGALMEDGEQTPRPENNLRRKTPNGILNAGYDGSAVQQNAQKHQILLANEDPRGYQHSGNPSGSKRTFLQHQQHQSRAYGWDSPNRAEWQNGMFPPPGAFPVMDSTLQQMPVQYLNQPNYYEQSVPSVLGPSFHYQGPTASGGQGAGPYGPYWHDGTFIPYRPAALRDPRFYHQPPANWPTGHPSQHPNSLMHQHAPASAQWTHPAAFSSYIAHLQFDHQNMLQRGLMPGPGLMPLSALPSAPNVRPSMVNTNHLSNFGPNLPGRGAGYHNNGSSDIDALGYGPYVEDEYGPSSPNGKQRDKVFAWALQQYRELLSFIHHTRRQQQHNRHAQGQPQVPQRPSFYPKPPRPSGSGSSSFAEKKAQLGRQARTISDSLSRSGVRNPASMAIDDSMQTAESAQGDPKSRVASMGTSNNVRSIGSEESRRRSYPQHNAAVTQQRHPMSYDPHGNQLLQTPSIVPPLDEAPPTRASVALAQITQLCDDSQWQWVDGMHLAGCIAYGLSNYEKAEKWYSKVLDKDPKHLEATSNLAATFLALGRRREAEQHWTKVVKSAPNHFEAVEHLIGMLCYESRSKDAIKVIEYVERCLRLPKGGDSLKIADQQSDCSMSSASRSPCISDASDRITYDFDADRESPFLDFLDGPGTSEPGFGSSGFAIPGSDNGRILALLHAKGNMLYALGDNGGAVKAFEDAVLIAVGRSVNGVQGLVNHISSAVATSSTPKETLSIRQILPTREPILLSPDQALATARLCFPYYGELSGLQHVPGGPQSLARKAVISTTSNSLLSLAKIFQDAMSNPTRSSGLTPLASGVRDILALYYLSLSLQPSPSTANNVGILLASIQQTNLPTETTQKLEIPGVVPGSGVALALQYYNYGLQLDQHHAHLYTNLGSLLKDIGQLDAAINMYERAVKCDGKFDIALANLANAVKDKGRIADAIVYYKRAVQVSPEFAEAVCGLANALNSVCGWQARGGIAEDGGKRDRWHVDANGMLLDATQPGASSSGWVKRVVDIVEKQLAEGAGWGSHTVTSMVVEDMCNQVTVADGSTSDMEEWKTQLRMTLTAWAGRGWEGARLTRLIERATKRIAWQWYQDVHVKQQQQASSTYRRPQLPGSLAVPTAPTVLPFHTFTCPMSAKQIRLISQRNGLRISVSTLRAPWLPKLVYPPPRPPKPCLRVGYVSSDFNNHPLAHLMQSVFGLHDTDRVEAFCYATTAGDSSIHRRQIENEAPHFHDASTWSAERLVRQIVADGIHILVNLNGYTRGARNEVFAARPAPIQMSFMGFAGTLGAEWCDYLLADETAIPPETLRPWRRNVNVADQLVDDNNESEDDGWVYGENIIYCRDTFFCCDHKQSSAEAKEQTISWDEERRRRWQMRKELFPQLPDETIILGNFNQLYKIEPTTFRTWLRILARVPNAILWLLRFPDLGESHLLTTARLWAGPDVASRVIFTDVAPKHLHISRARVCDLVLDTPECNAHTTAADVLWSGTPLLTLPRYAYKMCSRMAASILRGALPKSAEGDRAGEELVATSEEDYEDKAVVLAKGLEYQRGCMGVGEGRLVELRELLFRARWNCGLFDTERWVRDLEDGYEEAWRRWVRGEGGDIWLKDLPMGGSRAAAG